MRVDPTVARDPTGAWDFAWLAGTPPWHIWLDGRLLATVSDPEYQVSAAQYPAVPPDLEIVDSSSGSVAQNSLYPPYFQIQWYGIIGAAGYVVEQLVNSVWTKVHSSAERGQGYICWQTPALQDALTYQFRVTAVDNQGNGGTPVPFTFEVCRNPLHPAVTFALSSSGAVVVSPS